MATDSAVTLMIRSCLNGGDRQVQADLQWMVLQVKEQIQRDWPSHPTPSDQRLVYAGKLLQDSSLLKDVLRLEDRPFFIIHLVCRQTTPPPVTVGNPIKADHLRRRATGTTHPSAVSSVSATPTSPPSGAEAAAMPPSSNVAAWTSMPWTMDPAASTGAGTTSHAADLALWQQMYADYVNYYLHYFHSAHHASHGSNWNPSSTGMTSPWLQDEPAQAVLEPMAAAAAAAAAVTGSSSGAAAGVDQGGLHHDNNVAAAPVDAIDAAPVAAPQVGPNVVINAGAIEDDEEGPAGQPDLLDWFYVVSRFLALFSLVYFYSTLARFALVAGVGVILYLYQMGFFVQERRDAVAPADVAPPQQQEPRDRAQDQQNLPHSATDQIQPEPAEPNLINVAVTFIATFFSSILPNDPQIV